MYNFFFHIAISTSAPLRSVNSSPSNIIIPINILVRLIKSVVSYELTSNLYTRLLHPAPLLLIVKECSPPQILYFL